MHIRGRSIDTCFLALGLKPGASLEECKSSYRRMIKMWHPDKYSENAPHRLNAELISRELNFAFEQITEYYTVKPRKKPLRLVMKKRRRKKKCRKTKIADAVKETVEKVKTSSSSLARVSSSSLKAASFSARSSSVANSDFLGILRKKAA